MANHTQFDPADFCQLQGCVKCRPLDNRWTIANEPPPVVSGIKCTRPIQRKAGDVILLCCDCDRLEMETLLDSGKCIYAIPSANSVCTCGNKRHVLVEGDEYMPSEYDTMGGK